MSLETYRTSVRRGDFHADTEAFFSGRRVAVTGGSGFIGSHVVEQLMELGAQPVVLTRQERPRFLAHLDAVEIRRCDLADAAQTRRAMDGVSAVLSLAATVAGLEYNATHPASIFQSNMQAFMNTIGAANELGVDRFCVVSSACVYPRHCTIPTPESEGFTGEPEPTNSGYGWAKRMEEFLAQKYAEEFGLSVAIARPYNAYGPRDNFDPASSHVIPALILKAASAEGPAFKVWGDGSHSRSFLYVDDFARGVIEVAARYPAADPLNIGADEETTIRETAELVASYVSEARGREVRPEFDPQGLTGQPRRHCDTTKLESVLGFRARMPLAEGLRRTVQWFYEHERHALPAHAQ
jgi:GDP-L-fucose synthase